MLFLVLTGCAKPAYTDPSLDRDKLGEGNVDEDTGPADTGDTATGPVPGDPVTGELTFVDFQQGTPIGGIDVTLADETWTADETGKVTVTVPGTWDSDLRVDQRGWYPTNVHLATDDGSGWEGPAQLVAPDLLALLVPSFGVEVDEARAILVVSVGMQDDAGAWIPADHASVSLSAAYDVELTSTGGGLRDDDQVQDDGQGYVLFLNVAPGPVEIAVDPPSGTTCAAFPSTTRSDLEVTAVAAEVTVARVTCR